MFPYFSPRSPCSAKCQENAWVLCFGSTLHFFALTPLKPSFTKQEADKAHEQREVKATQRKGEEKRLAAGLPPLYSKCHQLRRVFKCGAKAARIGQQPKGGRAPSFDKDQTPGAGGQASQCWAPGEVIALRCSL